MTHPLDGIKVLEFAEHGFVPSAAAALADFGADVVKVERPEGDAMRTIIAGGMVAAAGGIDYMFELFNRNKRGISLDVQHPAGREAFERLVRWADVYVTNQLPRVRRKLRTEPDDLFALNPRLVYARGHGQGQRGRDAEAGGFDAVSYWARGGVAAVLTDEAAPRPTQQRPALGDAPSGMFLAGGICAALVSALRTGKGVVVDTSLLSGATWSLAPDLAYASLTGEVMPMARPDQRSPLTRQYRTADGRWLALMMIDEARYWAPACVALGLDDLIPAYPDPPSRRAGWADVDEQFRAVIAGTSLEELESRLRGQGCIYSSLSTPPEVLADQAVLDNGYAMPHPEQEGLRLAASPAQFDNQMPAVRRPAPGLGQHTREILAELGYSEGDVEALVTDDAVVAQ